MKLYKKNIAMLMAGLLALSSGAIVSSCDDDDDYDTNQFSNGGVSLTAASLQVTRGAYMTFKGTNLNRVTSVEFPGGVSSTPEVVDEHTIKALVPEGAEPGTVKLIYNGGELETKAIAFTEPITFDDFTPKEVTAGDEITISGTYLTYIEFVQFATGENVEIENTNRTELKLTIPVDASTGKFNLGYYSVDGKDTVETLLESAEILKVAEPSELKIATPTVKAGQDVEITGKLLRLVEYVSFNGADTMINVAAVDPTKDRESIKVALPAEAKDGDVTLTLFSGLEFVAGQVKTVVPTAAIKDKKDSYGVGDIVTIEGENLDLIVSGYLNGADADTLATFEVKDGNILLNVTKAAKSGDITLTLANGESIAVEGFVTTKPVFTFPASATPLDKLNIESTLGERVAKVLFGSVEATATKTDNGFSVEVPLEAENGCEIVAVMDNGEEVKALDSFGVNSFTFCAVTKFAEEETKVGNLLECTVKNGENLTDVLIDGEKTPYLLVGATLYVSVGTETGTRVMTLVSGETNVNYDIKVQATGEVEQVLYSDAIELDKWSANYELKVDFSSAPADASVRIRYTKTDKNADGPQMKIFDGHWGLVHDASGDNADNNKALASGDYIDLPISLFPYSDWGYSIILQGNDLIISSISWVKDYSVPVSIALATGTDAGGWKLPVELTWGDGGRLVIYKNNPVDLSSKVKVGATLYIDVTERHGQAQINDNSWTSFDSLADWNSETGLGDFTYEVPITQDYVDAFNKDGDIWLIIQGDSGFTIKDVRIK